MRTYTHIGIVIFAILSMAVVSASGEDAPSGLSAYITAATNRVSTLRGLQFEVVITNTGPTNVIINPWFLIHDLRTVKVFDSKGLWIPQSPAHFYSSLPPRDGIPATSRILKPGESFALKYKLAILIRDTPPGKYLAREGSLTSNTIEITIE